MWQSVADTTHPVNFIKTKSHRLNDLLGGTSYAQGGLLHLRCSTESTTFLVEGSLMPGRRWLPYIALLGAAASLACGDIASPTSPVQKRTTRTAPVGASFGRYILISGSWTCVEGCDDEGGPAPRAEGDSSATDALPDIPLDSVLPEELPTDMTGGI